MQTNNHKTAPADGYKITDATAMLLDCLKESSHMYDMIAEAMQKKYGAIMTPEEAEAQAQPYLDVLNEINDMLHAEITGSVVDALSDTKNSTAPVTLV